MPRLRELYLTRYDVPQQLSDGCISSILKLPHLQTLSLSGDISDAGLAKIAKAPKLESLSILYTSITGDGLSALEDSAVQALTLSTSQMRHPSSIKNLKKCRRLKSVTVNGQPCGEEDQWQRSLPHLGWGFHS